MGYFCLYREFVRIKVKSMLEARGVFIGMSLTKMSGWVVEIILIWVMINQFKVINGWKPFEVLLLFGFNQASYAVAAFFFFHPFTKLAQRIKSGEFDEILTKPMNPLLYLCCREVSAGYFSNIATAVGVMILCFINLGIIVTPFKIIFMLLAVLGGAAIHAALFMFTGTPSFWLVENKALVNILLFDLNRFIRYPISVYHKTIQAFLTFIIPIAFINFYPVQYFTGKSDLIFFHTSFQFLTPFVGAALLVAGYRFWKLGIKHYNSTGS